MTAGCNAIGWGELVAYRRGELGVAEERALEEHLFADDECARRWEELETLAAEVRALVEAGGVAAGVTEGLLAHARDRGVRLRTYRLDPGKEVACTASPDDDLVVVRLALHMATPDRVDMRVEGLLLPTGEETSEHYDDVVVDVAAGEIILVMPGAAIRSLPRSQWRYELSARLGGAEHRLGPYQLDHTPWDEGA